MLGDSLIVPKALEVAQPGDIIVIDAKGSCNNGVWGDNRSRVAKAIGLAGVVIDGAFRDIEENEALGFPIYARANACGRSTRARRGKSMYRFPAAACRCALGTSSSGTVMGSS